MGGTQETHPIPTEETVVDINAPISGKYLEDQDAIAKFFEQTAKEVREAKTIHEVNVALNAASARAEGLAEDTFMVPGEDTIEKIVEEITPEGEGAE